MRSLIALTAVAAIVALGSVVPHVALFPDWGFHPHLVLTLSVSL